MKKIIIIFFIFFSCSIIVLTAPWEIIVDSSILNDSYNENWITPTSTLYGTITWTTDNLTGITTSLVNVTEVSN